MPCLMVFGLISNLQQLCRCSTPFIVSDSPTRETAITRANEIAFICLLLFPWHKIVGRAAGVYLTDHIHRVAGNRQSRRARDRGGIGVLGTVGGHVGCRSIASIYYSIDFSCCCYHTSAIGNIKVFYIHHIHRTEGLLLIFIIK